MPLVRSPQPRPLSPSICATQRGNSLQAGLAELKKASAQAFGVGGQHAGGDKPCRFAASPADHGHGLPRRAS